MANKRRHPSSQRVDEKETGPSAEDLDQNEAAASSQSISDDHANTTSSRTPQIPCRNTDHLFVSPPTLDCAQNGCVPCAYKVGLFDVALDKDFCRQVPNQRPEQCPRLGRSKKHTIGTSHHASNDSLLGYKPGMSVLTVGDGDFSFSLAIARLLFPSSSSLSSSTSSSSMPSILVATSYESEDTLRRVYPDLDTILEELSNLGALVYYQVDATKLDTTLLPHLPKHIRQEQPGGTTARRWDRICWNFPCTAISSGQDGQNDAMEDNKALVRNFVANAIPMLRVPNGKKANTKNASWGDIHMCHKTKPPYDQWKLEQVAVEGVSSPQDDSSPTRSWIYRGRVVLDRALLPPYTPRKALDRKSFPCHDACIYMFGRDSLVAQQLSSSYNILPVTSKEITALRNNLLSQKASTKKRKFHK